MTVDHTPRFIFAKILKIEAMNTLSKLVSSATSFLLCSCGQGNNSNQAYGFSCKLAQPELQKRKEMIRKDLMKQVIERKDLKKGYAFKFHGTDEVIDQLTEFVKSERECCDFFAFGLLISGDKSSIWLQVTGPKGAKDFIAQELQI